MAFSHAKSSSFSCHSHKGSSVGHAQIRTAAGRIRGKIAHHLVLVHKNYAEAAAALLQPFPLAGVEHRLDTWWPRPGLAVDLRAVTSLQLERRERAAVHLRSGFAGGREHPELVVGPAVGDQVPPHSVQDHALPGPRLPDHHVPAP
jgi:hypothetical protein